MPRFAAEEQHAPHPPFCRTPLQWETCTYSILFQYRRRAHSETTVSFGYYVQSMKFHWLTTGRVLIHICLSAKQMILSFNSLLFKQLDRLSSVSSALSQSQEVTPKCPEVQRWRQAVVHPIEYWVTPLLQTFPFCLFLSVSVFVLSLFLSLCLCHCLCLCLSPVRALTCRYAGNGSGSERRTGRKEDAE